MNAVTSSYGVVASATTALSDGALTRLSDPELLALQKRIERDLEAIEEYVESTWGENHTAIAMKHDRLSELWNRIDAEWQRRKAVQP